MMPRAFHYPFDEFLEHMRALSYFRIEDVPAGPGHAPEKVRIDSENDIEPMLLRTLDYLSELVADVGERRFKAGRFVLMMGYIGKHLETFKSARLVARGSQGGPAHISYPLLKAVHRKLAEQELPQTLDATVVIDLARELKPTP